MEKRSWKDGRYTEVRKVGEGATKDVFQVWDETLEIYVALCEFKPHMYESYIRRARREVRRLANLNHPNIVRIYNFEKADGVYMITEYMDGGDLKTKMRAEWREERELDEVLVVAIEVAKGLSLAHSRNIFHRDVKPSNVLINLDGAVKLCDFGMARPFADESIGSGMVLEGTIPYMSPEQTWAQLPDRPSDMYSFGVTLYEMVTGRRPFYGASEDESDLAIVAEIRNSPPPPPSDYATCPPKLETLILDLLEKNPKNRPSADRVIQELQSIRASMRSETAPFIDKARLSEGLQYPTTIVPGFLGAVASLQLMHGMPSWYFEALVAAATALGVVAIGSFAWLYFVRHSQQYAEELERRIALLERPS